MQQLEKILEGIEDLQDISGWDLQTVQGILEIIRKHMAGKDNNVHTNDGWIPVEERLPTKEEFLKDDGRFILDDGNRRYQGLFDIYDGKFKFSRHISGIHYELFEDKCVIAWQPLPYPYRPERSRK